MAAFGKVKVTLTPLREACCESQLPMCFNCAIETLIIIPSLEGKALDLEAKFDDITALIAIKTKQNKRGKRERPTFLLIKSNRRRLCLALWPMCKLEFDQLIKIYERGGERMLKKKGSFQIWIAEKWHQSRSAEAIVTHRWTGMATVKLSSFTLLLESHGSLLLLETGIIRATRTCHYLKKRRRKIGYS